MHPRVSLRTMTLLGLLLASALAAAPRDAAAKWIWSPDTGFVDTKDYESADPQTLYKKARALFDKGKFDDAAGEFLRIGEYCLEPGVKEQSYYMYPESLFAAGKFYRAWQAFEEFLERYPRTPLLKEIIRRELACGDAMLKGAKKDILGVYILSGRGTGREIIRRVVEKYPYEEDCARYRLLLAQQLYQEESFEDSALEYDAFLKDYPDSEFAPTALYSKGTAQLHAHEGVEYDPQPLDDARKTFERYLEENPNGDKLNAAKERLSEIDDAKAEKDFETALFYVQRDKPPAARLYLKRIVKNFPASKWAKRAQEKLSEIGEK
ncbi:MAG: outer membrane protein assembly factor BamD [Planctomycetes bacterium]|nr:outer membrane protein assembly factor BamD [Planctomycetota bacterium]